jgi:hypothetical protein
MDDALSCKLGSAVDAVEAGYSCTQALAASSSICTALQASIDELIATRQQLDHVGTILGSTWANSDSISGACDLMGTEDAYSTVRQAEIVVDDLIPDAPISIATYDESETETATPSGVIAVITREQLVRFYEQHDPLVASVPERIEQLLDSNPVELMAALEDKYGEAPSYYTAPPGSVAFAQKKASNPKDTQLELAAAVASEVAAVAVAAVAAVAAAALLRRMRSARDAAAAGQAAEAAAPSTTPTAEAVGDLL